jgi:hypothetical protein
LWIVRGERDGHLTRQRSSGRHRCAAQAGSSDGGCARRFNRLVRWLCLAPDDCLQVSFFRAIFCTPKETSKTRESRDPPGVSRNVPQAGRQPSLSTDSAAMVVKFNTPATVRAQRTAPPRLAARSTQTLRRSQSDLGVGRFFYAPHMALCSAEPASPPSARHYRQFRAHHV